MIEQLQHKLIEWAENVGNLAYDQLPDFAMQIVAYKMWSATIGFYFGMVFFVIAFVAMICFLIACLTTKEDPELIKKQRYWDVKTERDVLFSGFAWMFFISLAVGVFTFSEYAVIKKCEVAPKVVIVDYIRKLNG